MPYNQYNLSLTFSRICLTIARLNHSRNEPVRGCGFGRLANDFLTRVSIHGRHPIRTSEVEEAAHVAQIPAGEVGDQGRGGCRRVLEANCVS